MSIEKNDSGFILYCDICGEQAEISNNKEFEKFQDAVKYKKQYCWKSIKHQGMWEDICPECQSK